MRANRPGNTEPEQCLRRELRRRGLRGYRIGRRIAGFRPDISFGPQRVAVFVHGCFWHRFPTCRLPLPRTNRGFWAAKFRANRQRDIRVRKAIESEGWLVLEVWSHELGRSLVPLANQLVKEIRTRV